MATSSNQGPNQDCIHHWVIDPAKSRTSSGKCLKCRSVKEFVNVIDITPMFNNAKTKPGRGRPKSHPELEPGDDLLLDLGMDLDQDQGVEEHDNKGMPYV